MATFISVSQMCETLSLPQSRFALGWRLCEPTKGQINGLPGSRGTLVATDGLTALIIGEDGSLYFGHYDWFVEDKEEKKATAKKTRILVDFIA